MAKNDKIETIPLSDILVDNAWNSRSGDWQLDKGTPDDSAGFEGLVDSIKSRGQDDPVDVRPNPAGKGKPYVLVTGFRRAAAIAFIANESKDKNPMIRAVVKEMTDFEARARNIVENTARDDLKGPDLAFGVFELAKMNPAMGQTELGKMTAKSQPYIGKLLAIMSNVLPKITKAWREGKQVVPVVDMYLKVSKVDKDRQQEAFDALLKASETKKPGKKGWLDAAKKRAASLGTLLGTLQRKELIDCENLVFSESIRDCFKFKADCTEKQAASVAAAADKAFEAAVNAKDDEKAATDDEDDE